MLVDNSKINFINISTSFIMAAVRKDLVDYLLHCNAMSVLGESIKQKIAQNKYFQIETVFLRMDKFSKGYLIPQDFS